MGAINIAEGVYWVGVQDPNLRVFDIIMETEYGTSYNSYLVKGSDKTVLFETVKEKFFDEFLNNLKEVADVSEIDYLIVNHVEPDHSGSVEKLLKLNPKITVLGSDIALGFLKEIVNKQFLSQTVNYEETLDLGGKTLKFISAPFLHWPDSIYTYLVEDGILFSCDSFGCHFSDPRLFNDVLDDDSDLLDAYKY